MGKTIRKYNRDPSLWVPHLTFADYPQMKYKQVCFGNCSRCKDHKKPQREKTHKIKEFRMEVKEYGN